MFEPTLIEGRQVAEAQGLSARQRRTRRRVGILSYSSPGHYYPLTALGRRLQSRGHEVVYLQVADLERPIRAAGGRPFLFRVVNDRRPSRRPAVALQQPAEAFATDHLSGRDRDRVRLLAVRHRQRHIAHALVAPLPVVVLQVLAEQMSQVVLAEHHEVVEALPLDRLDGPLTMGVHARGPDARPDDRDPVGPEAGLGGVPEGCRKEAGGVVRRSKKPRAR